MKRTYIFCTLLLPLFSLAGCRSTHTSGRTHTANQSTSTPGSPHFTDVAQAAGINYQWKTSGSRPLNILGTIGNGCAFLDYNNDGNLDILLVGSQLALYQGDGRGHFTNVTHQAHLDQIHGHFLGCAVGDYDNDGYEDIYLTAYRGGVLLHNQGGKYFVDVTKQAGIAPQPWGTSAAWIQTTNDGRLDLFICDYVAFGPHTNPQLCSNNGIMTACGPRFYTGIPGVLYHNLGNGKFIDVSKQWGLHSSTGNASGENAALQTGGLHGKDLGVASADFDGSGRQSLYVANDEVEGDLMQNLGNRFKNIGAESGTAFNADGNVHGGMGVDWGDYDNDGRLDLAVATFQHESKCIYHNDGGGLFTESSAQLGIADKALSFVSFGVKFFDFNNDGWLDLIFASGHVQDNIKLIDKSSAYHQPMMLLQNQNGTAFRDVSQQAGSALKKRIVGRGLAIGDYDNDGRVDVLVVDSEGAPLLLHNETSPVGNWIEARLVGKKSNRDGLGALVTFQVNGRKYLRLCQTDGSYLSASERRVHCGLGSASEAVISVRWPGGEIDSYGAVPANHIVTLVEGEHHAYMYGTDHE